LFREQNTLAADYWEAIERAAVIEILEEFQYLWDKMTEGGKLYGTEKLSPEMAALKRQMLSQEEMVSVPVPSQTAGPPQMAPGLAPQPQAAPTLPSAGEV